MTPTLPPPVHRIEYIPGCEELQRAWHEDLPRLIAGEPDPVVPQQQRAEVWR